MRAMAHIEGHAGHQTIAALRQFGVDAIFTLNGGHIWPFYDAARGTEIRIVDTRHEQSAAFAAEAYAKLTRRPGVAALTAGPGVTNGISAVTTAMFNGSPLVVLGGRAPAARWGAGSLQEFDHVPVLAPITKLAATVTDPSTAGAVVHDAVRLAAQRHRGPVFLDFPLDLFGPAAGDVPDGTGLRRRVDRPRRRRAAGGDGRVGAAPGLPRRQRRLLGRRVGRRSPRPPSTSGSRASSTGWVAARRRPATRSPSSAPAGCSSSAPTSSSSSARRSTSGSGSAGSVTPPSPTSSTHPPGSRRTSRSRRSPATSRRSCVSSPTTAATVPTTPTGSPSCEPPRTPSSATEAPLLAADTDPIKPTRIYGELRKVLDPDAIVVCDGGDFVSYAGKYVEVDQPGTWLDTGPYGCLGSGMGYAIAARTVHPDRQVVVLLGDGAAGFSLMDVDSLVRHRLPVVMIVGNNGIWGLEKHPMQCIYGWDVACDLQPDMRYDDVVKALGGAGETVRRARRDRAGTASGRSPAASRTSSTS